MKTIFLLIKKNDKIDKFYNNLKLLELMIIIINDDLNQDYVFIVVCATNKNNNHSILP